MKRLGIDFGSKKVGIAVSDDDGRIAFPKTILKNDAALLDEVAQLCRIERIDEIVIGESLDFAGTPNVIMPAIREFADAIRFKAELPVAFQKEYMTSLEARRPIDGKKDLMARKVKQEKMGNVDASAAALILQRYLDTINSTSR